MVTLFTFCLFSLSILTSSLSSMFLYAKYQNNLHVYFDAAHNLLNEWHRKQGEVLNC